VKYKVYISLLIIVIALLTSCSEKKKTTEVKQVSKPYFNLASGYFNIADTLEIYCDMDDVEIRFTTDDTEPNANSSIYQAPIVFNQTRLFKAKAFKDGWEPSATAFIRITMNVANINEVAVNGGSFTMGRTKGQGDSDELPTHQVTLSSFSIDKYETIFGDWLAVVGVYSPNYGVLPNGINAQPISYVSWYDAIKYCNLRSIAQNKTPATRLKAKPIRMNGVLCLLTLTLIGMPLFVIGLPMAIDYLQKLNGNMLPGQGQILRIIYMLVATLWKRLAGVMKMVLPQSIMEDY
jgi:hypothetical protein